VYELLTHKQCVLCGEKDRIVLDFHHKNKEDKIDSVARLAAFNTTKEDVWKESIVREMEKCDVLCANCHKRETAKQQRWIVRNVPAQ
jgi:5-methylcytosine-specific restriction endonuclease McrA